MKNKEHLPIFGIGPFLVAGMALTTAIAIVLFYYIFNIGTLNSFSAMLLCAAGVVLIITGVDVWFIRAVRSNMDKNIKENRFKTTAIYAWVRNPMYSGWWILFSGVSLLWHNILLLPVIFINWGIMTIVLKNTEEKWLHNFYGQEYEDYCKHVNRCIPWKRS